MAQPVTYTTGSETAPPVMTYQPMDAAQPMAYMDPGAVTYVDESGQPIQYVMEGAPLAYDMGGQPVTYVQDLARPAPPQAVEVPSSDDEPLLESYMQGTASEWKDVGACKEAHAMTDAVKSLKGFAGSAPPVKADKKKTKKKKNTGCC
ncbi:hypothetical protein AK812_SmicGene37860 [Symbiodinium microadriaticum]|uniref:Uncharacterized protein n=1 Tax=Symbiodinium microadriaticum TaxID=2951 RepID=A0A1Q9CF55_SYMMI|nr:hypothetical protein AK812_SmicGene37860 [Symbiodinium microadriaticum]